MNAPNNICESCRKGTVSPVIVESLYNHHGTSVRFQDEFMRCDNGQCGREFYTTEQSRARSRAITAALRNRDPLAMGGEEIHNLRLSFELTLPDFEKALGVGKNTVGRWERGTVPPSAAANFCLWVAANYPAIFEQWAQFRGVQIPRRRSHAVAATTSTAPSTPRLFPTFRSNPAHVTKVPDAARSYLMLEATGALS